MSIRPADQESLGDLGRQLADDAVRLVRLEIDLAKAELVTKAKRAAFGAGLLVGAALMLLLFLIFALAAIPEGAWTHLVSSWLGWIFTALVFLLVALLLGLLGMRKLLSLKETPETVRSIKENVEWAKRLMRRSGRSS